MSIQLEERHTITCLVGIKTLIQFHQTQGSDTVTVVGAAAQTINGPGFFFVTYTSPVIITSPNFAFEPRR